MADGSLEVMTLEGDNIKVKELHTRVKEIGAVVDGKDVLLRESLKQIRLKHMDDYSHHAEKSCLLADAPGLLFFDGGSYSSCLSDIGTNSVEFSDEEGISDEELFGSARTDSGWAEEGFEEVDAEPMGSAESGEAQSHNEGPFPASSGSLAEQSNQRISGSGDRALQEAAGRENPGAQYDGVFADIEEEEEEWREVAREEMLDELLRGTCKVAMLEHCLVESGRERVRVQMLLQTSGGRHDELDVQVLRLVLFKEVWMGEVDHHAQPPLHELNIAEAQRAAQHDLDGEFHALTLTAAVVSDPEAGSDSDTVKACFSREVEQTWSATGVGCNEEGVTWWLPHDVTVSMMMKPDRPREGEDAPMALLVRSTWKRDAFISVMETEFTATGVLRESRFSSLVPAVNSVPSMEIPVGA